MKKLIPILVIIIIAGCTWFSQETEQKPLPKGKCGDNVCDDFEIKNNKCPEDCPVQKEVKKRPLYVGIMIHLEGWNEEIEKEQMFRKHAEVTRHMAELLEKHDAVGTFEARPEFVEGMTNWGDNVLEELQKRGHGIGLHADLGGNADKMGMTQKQFDSQLKEMKQKFEKLSGIKIRHVSGICSSLDWASGAIKAGFEFTTGGVAYCVMSMPEENRPEEFKDCPTPMECHDTFPTHVHERIHPYRVSSAAEDWLTPDPNGGLVIFSAENAIQGLYEEDVDSPAKKKEFNQKDIQSFVSRMEEALSYADEDMVNAIYVGWSIGNSDLNDEVLEAWLEAIKPYVESGRVEWMSIPQMYDEYLDWEQSVDIK